MKKAERILIFDMAEQLKASNIAIRDLLHIALKHKPDIVPYLRLVYELNDTKMTRAYETLENE